MEKDSIKIGAQSPNRRIIGVGGMLAPRNYYLRREIGVIQYQVIKIFCLLCQGIGNLLPGF